MGFLNMTNTKPNLFRLIDVVSFGSPFIVCSTLTIYAACHGVTGSPLALLSVVSLAFLAIYVVILVARYRFIKRITFTTTHGLHVITHNFPISQNEIEQITESTIVSWAGVLQTYGQNTGMCREAVKDLYVFFKDFPIINSFGKFAGYAYGDVVVVGYKADLNSTALAHELGHYIYKEWMGTFENTDCHAFMRKHNLS